MPKRKLELVVKQDKMRKKQKIFKSLAFKNFKTNKLSKKVSKFIGSELTGNINSTTPGIVCINSVTLGSDVDDRIGNTILLKAFQMKFNCVPRYRVPSTTPVCIQLPCIAITLIYDNDPRGGLPAVTDIFNGAKPTDLVRFAKKDRFLILFNKLYTPECVSYYEVNSTGTTTVNGIDFHIIDDVYKKMALTTKFDGNAGDISDIYQGALYWVVRTDATVPGSGIDNSLSFLGDIRVRFEDV